MTAELYIGLMSGTSLDAIDAVLVQFEPLQILAFHSQPWPARLRSELLALCTPGHNEIERLGIADRQVGEAFADSVELLLRHWGGDRLQIRAIGSHGQTIRHQPNPPFQYSLQIGDANRIAQRCRILTLADFRRRDLAVGGQGAPLVPAVHAALFRSPERDRVILNLGGIANITLLPQDLSRPVTGYDTGPANLLLDGWCQQQQGQAFDAEGRWAQGGQIDPGLLSSLLTEPYLNQAPPKSTGRELFNLDWLQPHLANRQLEPQNVQTTLTEYTALTVAEQIRQSGLQRPEIFVCGGGAFNRYLLSRLQQLLPDSPVNTTDALQVPPQQLEAVAFAWLARQTLLGLAGNLPSVTGASQPCLLGALYPAG